jgi:hypothetical protein
VRISGLVLELRADDVLVVTLDGSPVMIDTEGDAPVGVVGTESRRATGNGLP